MKHYTIACDGKEYRQISKPTAKKLYLAGVTVIAVPANINPFNKWGMVFNFSRLRDAAYIIDEIGAENRFDELCNSAVYYNCNNETGKYLRFYVAN